MEYICTGLVGIQGAFLSSIRKTMAANRTVHRSEHNTPVTGKMPSTSQYGGVSKMYQVQGKVPAFVNQYKK